MWQITNTSTGGQTVRIQIGKEAVAGQGIPLYPGGLYGESLPGSVSQEVVNVIADAAGATIAVIERIQMETV